MKKNIFIIGLSLLALIVVSGVGYANINGQGGSLSSFVNGLFSGDVNATKGNFDSITTTTFNDGAVSEFFGINTGNINATGNITDAHNVNLLNLDKFNLSSDETDGDIYKFRCNGAVISGACFYIQVSDSGTVASALAIQHNGEGDGINVYTTNDASSLLLNSDGNPAYVATFNSMQTTGGYVQRIIQSATSTSSTNMLDIDMNSYGTGYGIKIDSLNNNAKGIYIKMNSTTTKAIYIANGSIDVDSLAGTGNAYVCVNSGGTFYRSATACVS